MRAIRIAVDSAVVAALLACWVPVVHGETISIGPLKNANPADVSSLSADCDISADSRQMTCSFVQTRVDLAKKPDTAAAELEKQLQGITAQDIAATCKGQRKDMSDLSAKIAGVPDVAPRLKTFFTGWVQRFNAMCDKPTIEGMREYLWYGLQKETRTCRIWSNPWKETFTKQLGDKWVSNRGPSGICGVVNVSTLESKPIDPKKPSPILRLWTYETQKVVTNKAVGGPFCELDETRVRYSWDAKDFDRTCEFIEFGF